LNKSPQTLLLDKSTSQTWFVSVAIAVPVRRVFEYRIDRENKHRVSPQTGMRVEVKFAGRVKIGIILSVSQQSTFDANKIKPVERILDDQPICDQRLIQLATWMQKYYHAPPGEVWQTLLPNALLKGEACIIARHSHWRLTSLGMEVIASQAIAKNAVKQHQVMQVLLTNHANGGITNDSLASFDIKRSMLQNLAGKKWVEQHYQEDSSPKEIECNIPVDLILNLQQQNAIDKVCQSLNKFKTWLLFGVTASGKTEVYLRIIQQVVAHGQQALILVPEIGLTPQTVKRFQQRFSIPVDMLHSGMSEKQRLQVWLKAQKGLSQIIIGTRSALFVPLKNPGIIIIDEEHDSSFKQQQGLRYSTRDIAMVRGSLEKFPVLLGSASPSIDTLMNVKNNKISLLKLDQKAMTTTPIKFKVVDLKNQPMKQGLSFALIESIAHHLKQQGQVLLFLNRRGYSPVLLCHHCGWSSQCKRCDTHFTYHGHAQQSASLQCHHCGSSRRAPTQCPDCLTKEMVPVGLGTERLEESIKILFPNARVRRIDRDTTRKKQSMKNFIGEIKAGQVDILIGTQMLAKGHHFPDVTLVGMVDMDGALYSSDFRAPEYAAQLITQVSGRTGRADKPGEVLIQTHLSEHPMLKQVLHHGYDEFAKSALQERMEANLPPASYNALFQAEATQLGAVKQFLQEVKQLLNEHKNLDVLLLGPAPAVYTKKAGKFRYQLYLESNKRLHLHQLLDLNLASIEKLKSANRVKWRLEVDPIGD
jgi:primosomal protein N' (replication factor Y) (superfamily II helicase)